MCASCQPTRPRRLNDGTTGAQSYSADTSGFGSYLASSDDLGRGPRSQDPALHAVAKLEVATGDLHTVPDVQRKTGSLVREVVGEGDHPFVEIEIVVGASNVGPDRMRKYDWLEMGAGRVSGRRRYASDGLDLASYG